MKKKFFILFTGVFLCSLFAYAQEKNDVDVTDMKNQQVEFENAFRNLRKQEQETIERKDKVVQDYTSKHLELMQETNDVNFELYSVKLDQEKNYQQYISFLEQTISEITNARFQPLDFKSIKQDKKKAKKRR